MGQIEDLRGHIRVLEGIMLKYNIPSINLEKGGENMLDESIRRETLARLLHESGRQAVEERKIYRSDLPIKPFCEWDDLDENAKEGRRMMADYLLDHWDKVVDLLTP